MIIEAKEKLSMFSLIYVSRCNPNVPTAVSQPKWCSPIFAFFHSEVTVEVNGGQIYYYFKCKAPNCKGAGGVKQFMDTQNGKSTSNLQQHAIACFGKDEVTKCHGMEESSIRSKSIVSFFGRAIATVPKGGKQHEPEEVR